MSAPSFAPHELSDATVHALTAAGLRPDDVVVVLRRAFEEDLGETGDVTSAATVDTSAMLEAAYRCRSHGVVAGMPVLRAVFDVVCGDAADVDVLLEDGTTVGPGTVLATVTAPARALLAAERTSLNLLGHLSGVATVTRRWVEAVAGTGVAIRDTRKTMPGLRDLDKYAVRCGGGTNHRRGLDDAYLVKDNHVAAAGSVAAAVERIRAHGDPALHLQVEVDDLAQLDEALALRPDSILLDNFDVAALRDAVRRARAAAPATKLEASGGITLETARTVAETGVDFLAVGALTHSAPQLDIGLDIGPGIG
jgi:nicotinate-nucleotide pyrophosphorylase (carboxylating)